MRNEAYFSYAPKRTAADAFFNSLLLNPAAQDDAIKASIIAHDVKSAIVSGACKQSANSRPLIMPDFKHQRPP